MKKLAITLNLIIFIPPLITLLLDILLWCLSLFTEYYEHESMFGPYFVVFYCCFFFVIFVSIMSVIHILKENKLTIDCNGREFYFVHTYTNQNCSEDFVLAKADYGTPFNAILGRENIFGVQFHPEKSQNSGFILFKNFIDRIC